MAEVAPALCVFGHEALFGLVPSPARVSLYGLISCKDPKWLLCYVYLLPTAPKRNLGQTRRLSLRMVLQSCDVALKTLTPSAHKTVKNAGDAFRIVNMVTCFGALQG